MEPLKTKLEKADIEVTVIPAGNNVTEYMIKHCIENDLDAMAAINVSVLKRQVELWRRTMPSVQPFYAIKCNPHPVIVKTLFELGTSFDCATPNEIQKALRAGAKPTDIIYANPQKQAASIKKAFEYGVNCFTFDSEMELTKMIQCIPAGMHGRFVLRIMPPINTGAHQNFSSKFGATRVECERLIKLAAKLKQQHGNFDLYGFSFHVGTGCPFAEAYKKTIEECCRLCQLAQSFGFSPKLLDIGGGFITPSALLHLKDHELLPPVHFEEIGAVVEQAVSDAKSVFGPDMIAVAEPGRFFASDGVSLVTRVYGRRIVFDYDVAEAPPDVEEVVAEQKAVSKHCTESSDELTESSMMDHDKKIEHVKYYVGEGMYGFFNNIMFDHALPDMRFFRGQESIDVYQSNQHLSYIFGPTCDSMDVILDGKKLPLLEVGDFITISAFGAYTWAAATEFNGIAVTQMVSLIEEQDCQ